MTVSLIRHAAVPAAFYTIYSGYNLKRKLSLDTSQSFTKTKRRKSDEEGDNQGSLSRKFVRKPSYYKLPK